MVEAKHRDRLTSFARIGRSEALSAALVLGGALCLGLAVCGDYGVGWDEPIQHRLGRQAWRYVWQESEGYLRNPNRIYGTAFELLLQTAERLLRLEDLRAVHLLRHTLTFLTFWTAVVAFYALSRRLFRSWRLGLLASTLLLSMPRIVADSFYNTKDLPFLSFIVIAVFTLLRFVDEPTLTRATVHGLACGVATDVRIAGVVLAPLTLLTVWAAWREDRLRPLARARGVACAALMTAGYACAVALLWPYLWQDPLRRFAESFSAMARFPWQEPVLFLGERSPAPQLPWFYLPVWIGITTPVTVLVFVLVGALERLRAAWVQGRVPAETVVMLGWAALPVAVVVTLRSVLYDGWRQMYFVCPGMVLLAVAGVRAAGQAARDSGTRRWTRAVAAAALLVLAVDVAATAWWMLRWHPYQNVYFNRLAGSRASVTQRFDVDYWGLSTRRLLEQIVASDGRPAISVLGVETSVTANAEMLPRDDRSRLRFVGDTADADYIVTHHRYGPADEQAAAREVFSLWVDGMRIGSVLRGLAPAPPPGRP